MVEINETTTPTVQAIYDSYKRTGNRNLRNHLGASRIGNACQRELWYEFRHAYFAEVENDGRMLRLFDTGNLEEGRLIKDLENIGIKVEAFDGDNQFRFVEPDNKFFSGSADGFGTGFIEAPKTRHLLEFKTMNTTTFKLIRDKGVKLVKPEHYAQMQTYMRWSKTERAYYLAVCKETDEIYGERVKYDKEFSHMLRELAHGVVTAQEPPKAIGGTPDYYKCRYCDAKALCHGYGIPLINCRTCALSTPNLMTGKFECESFKTECPELTVCDCPRHVILPSLIKAPINDASDEEQTITYMIAGKKITNGYKNTPTKQLLEVYAKWKEVVHE